MSTWLDAIVQFAQSHDIADSDVELLRCFAGPEPRGGPPPPPEEPWDGDFASLERARLAASLDGIATLLDEVDPPQAEMFARRLRAVDTAIASLGDDFGRLLRVGLRQRVRSILASPRSRATRIRALADFYFSYVGLHRHRRSGRNGLPLEQMVRWASWRSVQPGIEHARLDGASDLGPIHVNLLRIDPLRTRLEVEDCRDSVQRGEAFTTYVTSQGAVAAISGGFFLYSEPDIEPPSRRFDPVGLLIQRGQVLNPPVFRRGSLLIDAEGGMSIEPVSMLDTEVETEAGHRFRPSAVFNRASRHQGPPGPTAAVVGHEVIAVGPSLPIPLNGFVIPQPEDRPLAVGDRLRYRAVHGSRGPVYTGLAGGPMLLHEGQPCLHMQEEDFWGTAPPVTFSQDETGDRNLLPRMGAGLTPEGTLVLAAVDGRNLEHALGMTLGGVARLLRALGCHVATNLDGGSSKRMVVKGRALDLASTEIVSEGVATVSVRPVHTALLIFSE
ncbi:MAG: phosphodiester glycosidase family protein [Myxococcota bacterium]